MTATEIATIKDAIKACGLQATKFPKKIEIRIPKAKYPGVYFNIPLDVKSFKIQVYFHQTSFVFFEKVDIKGLTVGGDDLHKTINIIEYKGIPKEEEEITEYLNQALEKAEELNLMAVPSLV